MSTLKFSEFVQNLVIENLHPELHKIVTSRSGYHSKQSQLAKKIKELTSRGEKTGMEGNMPKGSSRGYLKHSEPHNITLDGKPAQIKTGTKVAIRARLDAHHKPKDYDGRSLGAMQNHAEGGDHFVNKNYRILSHDTEHPGHFHSNTESGIFPPLIDHDHENHEWSHVGHARDIKAGEFNQITKTPTHPKGISHKDFVSALTRFHDRNFGKHWEPKDGDKVGQARSKHLDHIDKHPLVQKFQDYHGNTGNSPTDYGQKRNLGVFEHPDGSKHIVARDHGFNSDVQHAYTKAIKHYRNNA